MHTYVLLKKRNVNPNEGAELGRWKFFLQPRKTRSQAAVKPNRTLMLKNRSGFAAHGPILRRTHRCSVQRQLTSSNSFPVVGKTSSGPPVSLFGVIVPENNELG